MQIAAARGQWLTDVLRMPAEEWPVWVALSERHRLGPAGDDYRAGVIAAKVHNGLTAGGNKIGPDDVFPGLRPQHRRRKPGERGRADPGLKGWFNRSAPAAH